MRYKLLGNTGLRVSELALGAMGFNDKPGAPSQQQIDGIVDTFQEAGGNVIDTAVTYGDGQSERAVAHAVRGRREQFVLSTKYTLSRDIGNANAAGNHRKNTRSSLEASLRQLDSDYIDIYWVHVWDRHTPIEETMRALDDAVRAGKVLYVGISNAPAWLVSQANTIAEWRDWTPFAGIQVPYNLLNRDAERELLPMAEQLGLSVVAWGPLAHGRLAMSKTQDTEDDPVLTTLAEVAKRASATPAQVAIAWLMSRSQSVIPILGATNADHFLKTLEAATLTLSPEDLDSLTAATGFSLGYPREFVEGLPGWAFGAAGERVDGRSTR
ncbi:aldo/keto reductase [Rhodococcus sp. H29-C3]|uniref:aldo/keto reductase n=1 Tax=Rhodococcus sp. H29-C3 TaxID=3046307 RepID=UPI0024BABCCE|nr:aldo/keto reductase [Rhodococcus sp. H29-C3]MDJ0362331.1 aldo/keto reductase [Rhodococcus sp. H29-C3]